MDGLAKNAFHLRPAGQILMQRLQHRGTTHGRSSVTRHGLGIHAMERMHAFLLLDAVAASLVAPGVQIFLHDLADSYILDLDLMAEINRRFGGGTS
jgi:hypothetical protein